MPGSRDPGDNAKLGLAVEGGGMRGVISAAMLACLEDRGLVHAFDWVYGCSSGAVNAAYFPTAENLWYPASIYYEDLTTSEFLSYWRAATGRSMLDLDFAYNTVVGSIKPLDYDKVLASPVGLTIGITLVDKLVTLPATGFRSKEELRSALIASAWLPLAVRGTGEYRGERAIDGGILTALPFHLAVADGCTHVLSLGTKPMSPVRNPVNSATKYAVWYLNRLHKGLGDGYLRAVRQKEQDRRQFLRTRLAPDTDGQRSHIVRVWASTSQWILMDFIEGIALDILLSNDYLIAAKLADPSRTFTEILAGLIHGLPANAAPGAGIAHADLADTPVNELLRFYGAADANAEARKSDDRPKVDFERMGTLGCALFDALDDLESQGITHEDLAPQNIIVANVSMIDAMSPLGCHADTVYE